METGERRSQRDYTLAFKLSVVKQKLKKKNLQAVLLPKGAERINDARAIAVEMLLHIHDRAIALLPDSSIVRQFRRNTLSLQ